MHADQRWQSEAVAVLISGGLDSAILVGELARVSPRVYPIYVHFGLIWEPAEVRAASQFLDVLASPAVAPLKILEIPLGTVYGQHWSTTGQETPDDVSTDESVFLPGRTLLLFSQAAIWCHLQRIPTIAVGILAGNPFPDSTREFLESYERLVNCALADSLQFVAPYRSLTKTDILRRGREFPLAETLSCLHPQGQLHCGACNKCGERRRAFAAAEIPDPTDYAARPKDPAVLQ